jgi:lysophospholipase L1-like esterase
MTIWMIGDSTAANKQDIERPQTGWAEMLNQYLTKDVQINNLAKNGASTQSFIESDRFTELKSGLQKNDFVLIQFGHNDQKVKDERFFSAPWGRYQKNIIYLIDLIQDMGAKPILLTSITRRNFNDKGIIVDTFGDYLVAIRQLAAVYKVPLVDMNVCTKQKIEELGIEASKKAYLHFEIGEFENYPQGIVDNTHLSPMGANLMAKLFVEQIKQSKTGLEDYFL